MTTARTESDAMAKRYSVYDRRTDQPVIIYATARECAAAMGLTEMSFYSV